MPINFSEKASIPDFKSTNVSVNMTTNEEGSGTIEGVPCKIWWISSTLKEKKLPFRPLHHTGAILYLSYLLTFMVLSAPSKARCQMDPRYYLSKMGDWDYLLGCKGNSF